MRVVDVILAKRRGEAVPAQELKMLIEGYTDGSIPDYQMSAFLMAVVFQGMTHDELGAFVDAMLHSGEVLDLSDVPGVKVDKHSTGGVGDKVSLILTPLAMAAGVRVPMIAGRGLGHTGGTIDKLEAIPGYNPSLNTQDFRKLLHSIGGAIIGQTAQIAPADKKLYALRDVTGTVRCIPLITSSIMSKKMAEGIDALVLDIKVGNGAFMSTVEEGKKLAESMIGVGKSLGRRVRALLTDMNQPLGNYVGNALEVIESIDTLKGQGPKDLTDITLELTADMVDMAGLGSDRLANIAMLKEKLHDGSALEMFRQIISAQGGDERVIDNYNMLPSATHTTELISWEDGYITHMNTTEIGIASVELGGGRMKKEDHIDHAVGFVFHHKLGDQVHKGTPMITIHYNDNTRRARAMERLRDAITIGTKRVPPQALIIERLGD